MLHTGTGQKEVTVRVVFFRVTTNMWRNVVLLVKKLDGFSAGSHDVSFNDGHLYSSAHCG